MKTRRTRHTIVVSQGMAWRHPYVHNLEQITVVQSDSSASSTYSLHAGSWHLVDICSSLIRLPRRLRSCSLCSGLCTVLPSCRLKYTLANRLSAKIRWVEISR
jgi:hypothetical protein